MCAAPDGYVREFCINGDICRGILESLCLRHGGRQAFKDIKRTAKRILSRGRFQNDR